MDERGWKCSTFPALVTVFLSELMWRIPRMILFRNVPKLEIALYVRHFSTECRTSIRAIVRGTKRIINVFVWKALNNICHRCLGVIGDCDDAHSMALEIVVREITLYSRILLLGCESST